MEQIGQPHDRRTEMIMAISKKHWATYIFPAIAVFIGIICLFTGHYLIMLLFFIAGITKLLSNKSTAWTLTNEDLIIKSGFLPWRKVYYVIPKEDIFEAYYRKSAIGTIFGYGTLNIRRTEGTTTSFHEKGMTNPDEITGSINSLIRELKKNPKVNFVNLNTNHSIADEIQKLVELKNQGLLSEEEFSAHKQKLIDNR